jgi:hypothetical protein
VLTALNESDRPYAFIDLRGSAPWRELYSLISRSLSELVERASRWGKGEFLKFVSRLRELPSFSKLL